jgi:transposase
MELTPEQFVRIWTKCDSIAEVAKKTGLTKSGVYNRAHKYRKLGVKLKRYVYSFGGRPALNIERLNQIAAGE